MLALHFINVSKENDLLKMQSSINNNFQFETAFNNNNYTQSAHIQQENAFAAAYAETNKGHLLTTSVVTIFSNKAAQPKGVVVAHHKLQANAAQFE